MHSTIAVKHGHVVIVDVLSLKVALHDFASDDLGVESNGLEHRPEILSGEERIRQRKRQRAMKHVCGWVGVYICVCVT